MANNPSDDNTVEEETTVDISVSVTDGNSGVQGVTVAVADTEISATTGPAGGCTLKGVPVGTVTITATKEGYVDYSDSETITSETTSLEITLTEE